MTKVWGEGMEEHSNSKVFLNFKIHNQACLDYGTISIDQFWGHYSVRASAKFRSERVCDPAGKSGAKKTPHIMT